jgi:hypothetical protein
MSSHTPGSWTWDHSIRGGVIVCDMNADAIAILGSKEYPSVMANARLIAAAPELLEALKSILDDRRNVIHVRTEARAAIARAEGKE